MLYWKTYIKFQRNILISSKDWWTFIYIFMAEVIYEIFQLKRKLIIKSLRILVLWTGFARWIFVIYWHCRSGWMCLEASVALWGVCACVFEFSCHYNTYDPLHLHACNRTVIALVSYQFVLSTAVEFWACRPLEGLLLIALVFMSLYRIGLWNVLFWFIWSSLKLLVNRLMDSNWELPTRFRPASKTDINWQQRSPSIWKIQNIISRWKSTVSKKSFSSIVLYINT